MIADMISPKRFGPEVLISRANYRAGLRGVPTGFRVQQAVSARQMPLHETSRHQRRRDESTFLIIGYSN